jgi:aldehyde:ferredoxin oxidoreductase
MGQDVPATADALKAETSEEAKVACIGPAGENLVKMACIINDYNRAAGRTGVGAVMGFKKLKAIIAKARAVCRSPSLQNSGRPFRLPGKSSRLIR